MKDLLKKVVNHTPQGLIAILASLLIAWLITTLILGLFADALPWESPKTETWFFKPSPHTVNGQLGYDLGKQMTSAGTSGTLSTAGATNVHYGFRVYLRSRKGVETELSNGIIGNMTSVYNASAGYKTASWLATRSSIQANTALVVRIYSNITGSWATKYVFITNVLETNLLYNSTWSFRLRLWTRGSGASTLSTFYWGQDNWRSQISSVQYLPYSPWDAQQQELEQGHLFNFIIEPWFYYLENLVYFVVFLAICGSTYLRYNDARPVIFLIWLFGGTGGILTALIPAIGLHISWFLLAFALAATIFYIAK